MFEVIGVWEILSDKEEYSIIGHEYCDEDDFPQNEDYCLETADKLFGVSEGQLNVTMLPWMFDYQSEGTSQKVRVQTRMEASVAAATTTASAATTTKTRTAQQQQQQQQQQAQEQ